MTRDPGWLAKELEERSTKQVRGLVCQNESCGDSHFLAHTWDPDNFSEFRETHKGHEVKEIPD